MWTTEEKVREVGLQLASYEQRCLEVLEIVNDPDIRRGANAVREHARSLLESLKELSDLGVFTGPDHSMWERIVLEWQVLFLRLAVNDCRVSKHDPCYCFEVRHPF